MSEPADPQNRQPSRRRAKLSAFLCLAGLFLTGLGAKLWLINTYGTSLPFWDQWDEARVVYSPYFEGKLRFADLFQPHNEHRIFFTRVYDLVILKLNGQWDNRVEMVANALIHVATMVGFGWLMARKIGLSFAPVVVVPLALSMALPFAWENTLSGFHSQHYFMVVFALPALWLLGTQKPGTWQWWCGVFCATAGLFTVGAGLITPVAICVFAFLKVVLNYADWRKLWPTLIVGICLAMVGLALKVEIPHHTALKAHSISEFLMSLGKYLSWPWIVLPPYAVFNLFPMLILAWLYIRHADARTQATEIILLVGLWTCLQCLAAAYARGAKGAHPQWRYMDTTSFLMIANSLSLLLIWTRYRTHLTFSRYLPTAATLWIAGSVSGALLLTYQAMRWDIPFRQTLHHMEEVTLRGYLETGDKRYFNVRKLYLARFEGDPTKSQDHDDKLIEYINLPHVRSLLPVNSAFLHQKIEAAGQLPQRPRVLSVWAEKLTSWSLPVIGAGCAVFVFGLIARQTRREVEKVANR